MSDYLGSSGTSTINNFVRCILFAVFPTFKKRLEVYIHIYHRLINCVVWAVRSALLKLAVVLQVRHGLKVVGEQFAVVGIGVVAFICT
jgi:hypothetical protein